jgi:hypothetical protein
MPAHSRSKNGVASSKSAATAAARFRAIALDSRPSLPAKAGNPVRIDVCGIYPYGAETAYWMPAFAGMTIQHL